MPETPDNFVMVTHSSRQANLSWSLPYDGKSPILAFHLEFHRPDAGKGDFLVSSLFKLFKDLFSLFFKIGFQGPQVIAVPGNATWWEVDFLQPNRLYFVRLLAVNALGASKPTPRLRIKTANALFVSLPIPSSKVSNLHQEYPNQNFLIKGVEILEHWTKVD